MSFKPKAPVKSYPEKLPNGEVQMVTEYDDGAEVRVNVFAADYPDAKEKAKPKAKKGE
jgi:hypothetical protein